MHHYIDMPGTYIPKHCIYGPRQNEGLVLTGEEWNRITSHLTRRQRLKAQQKQEIEEIENKKLKSKAMVETWDNTIATTGRILEQRRKAEIEKEAQEKVAEYHEIIKRRKEQHVETIEKARHLIFLRKPDCVSLLYAVREAEIQRENKALIDHINSRVSTEKEKDEAAAAKMVKEAEEAREKAKQKLIDERKKRLEVGEYYRRLFACKEEKEKREKEERMRTEIMDLEKIAKEIKFSEEYAHKKSILLRAMKEEAVNTDVNSEMKKILQLEEEEEDAIIKIYAENCRKLRRMKMDFEKKLIEDKLAEREKLKELLNRRELAAARDETERMKAAEMAREKRELDDIARKEAKMKKEAEGIKEQAMAAEKEKQRQELITKDTERWTFLQNMKTEEHDEAWRKEREAKIKQLVDEKEAMLEQQVAEFRRKREAEIEARKPIVSVEDETNFLEYAEGILKDAIEAGRPIKPIEQCIKAFRQRTGMYAEKKEDNDQQKKTIRKGEISKGAFCLIFDDNK